MTRHEMPKWVTQGKTIRQLIAELQSFADQDVEVRISFDYAETHRCISTVELRGEYCVLINTEEYHKNQWQDFMDESAEKFGGMTVNERLFAAGLIDKFDSAATRRDRAEMIAILSRLEMTSQQCEQTVDTILANPALYGF